MMIFLINLVKGYDVIKRKILYLVKNDKGKRHDQTGSIFWYLYSYKL